MEDKKVSSTVAGLQAATIGIPKLFTPLLSPPRRPRYLCPKPYAPFPPPKPRGLLRLLAYKTSPFPSPKALPPLAKPVVKFHPLPAGFVCQKR